MVQAADPYEQNILQVIGKHGWYIALVPAGDGKPAFTYTIGLHDSYQHPDVLIECEGATHRELKQLMTELGERVKAGKTLTPGMNVTVPTTPSQVLTLRDGASPETYVEYLGYGIWYYATHRGYPKPFPVLAASNHKGSRILEERLLE